MTLCGFLNEGEVELDSPGATDAGVVLNLIAGNIFSPGLIAVSDSGGGMLTAAHEINGDVFLGSTGLIDVQADLDITATTLGLGQGTLNVAEGETLTVTNAVIELTDSGDWVGGGVIETAGTTSFDIAGEFVYERGDPTLDITNGSVALIPPQPRLSWSRKISHC